MISFKSVLLSAALSIAAAEIYPHTLTEYTFATTLDHFTGEGTSGTFNIRYLVNAQYWEPQAGPILFYAGNEGDIYGFYENSGFMTETLA